MNTNTNTAIALGLAATIYYFAGYCMIYFKINGGSWLARVLRSTVLALFWPILMIVL